MLDLDIIYVIVICFSFIVMSYLVYCCFISLKNISLIDKEIERRLEDINKDLDEDLVLISNRIKDVGYSN